MCLVVVIKAIIMADKKYIDWRVIARRLLGKATPEECEQVESWMEESAENATYYRKAERYFGTYYTGLESRSVDVEGAWTEFLAYTSKAERRLRLRKIVRLAAAVVVPLFVACFVWWLEEEKPERVEVARRVSIEPGTLKAVLEVASGKRIALSDTVNVVRVARELNGRQEQDEAAPDETVAYNTILVPKGGEFKLTLADGTRIVLNSDSRLRFPERFAGDDRQVFLEGEAFFEVARDTSRPFVVGVQESRVRVLGTSFNVKGYGDDAYIQTTLVEGKVGFQAPGRAPMEEIAPGEQITYEKETGKTVVRAVNPDVYTAWIKGAWIMEGVCLDEMMKQLSRWYDVSVFYQNPEAKELVFTGDLERYENCEDILRLIEMTTDVRFEIKDRTIIVKIHEKSADVGSVCR